MKPRNPFCILFFCILIAVSWSCGKRNVNLDKSTRNRIDTLAAREISVLRVKLDSICDAQFDSLVSVAVDSILDVRQAEIDQILKQ